MKAFRAFLANQWLLCSPPILVLVVIASLDNADKQLLSSSFPILEKTLGWGAYELGNFSLANNLAYALSLPVWGWLIHRRSDVKNLQQLLASACGVWGLATIGIAVVTRASDVSMPSPLSSSVSRNLQVAVRSINGMALGSILPLSQSLLSEYVPENLRGQAFGMLGAGEKLAGTLASTCIVWLGDYWYYVYYVLGLVSVAMGLVAHYMSRITYISTQQSKMNDEYNKQASNNESDVLDDSGMVNDSGDFANDHGKNLSLRQIIKRIIRLPAFICLVAQGVFGGTPWDMMSFLLLLMDWKGFTKEQIALIQITSGFSSMLGGWFGGVMGDYAARGLFGGRKSSQGRIILALASVILGIPLYGLFLYSTNYSWALLWMNLFQLTATWAPPAAIRPICVDLTNGPSERAQIVALWIVLEKLSGALFGAPLVGYLTNRMITSEDHEATNNKDKAEALAFNLFLLSGIFWGICAFFWFVMLITTQRTQIRTSHKNFGV